MISPEALAQRYIPFSSLRYSTEAFIDYCIPECMPKFNYALIGPGVSQNPNQPISLREFHGFQVGGVSIPHGKINTPHMHFTCEVFICAKGQWDLNWGFNPQKSSAPIGDGDIASMPTWLYRGFTNTGPDDGFLFTVLGGDNTGGVLWGPTTLAAAQKHGVFLSEDYQIIDTTRGEQLPQGKQALKPMTPEQIAALRVWTLEQMQQRIVRFADLQWSSHGLIDSAIAGCGAQIAPVIGLGITQDRNAAAPITNAHGVSVEWLRVPAGGKVSKHCLNEKQVLIAKRGALTITTATTAGSVDYTITGGDSAWDTFSVPAQSMRQFENKAADECFVLMLTAGDHRKKIQWDEQTLAAAQQCGYGIDANGFVAPQHLINLAQK